MDDFLLAITSLSLKTFSTFAGCFLKLSPSNCLAAIPLTPEPFGISSPSMAELPPSRFKGSL